MDIIQELIISTEYLQSLQICDNIPLLQWFIDEDIAECDVNMKRFGKFWNKSGYGCKSKYYTSIYQYGKRIIYEGLNYIGISSNDVLHKFLRRKRFNIKHGSVSLFWDVINETSVIKLLSIEILLNQTYEGLDVNTISIDRNGYISIYENNELIINNVKYDIPFEIIPKECKATTKTRLSRVNHSTTWKHGSGKAAAGYLTEQKGKSFTMTADVDLYNHVEIPHIWDTYSIRSPFTPQVFNNIMQMLPPVSLESTLYTPEIYIDQLNAIEEYLLPLITAVELI